MSKPRKLPSGSWHIRYFDSSGKRQSETFKTQEAAQAALRGLRRGIADPLSTRALSLAYDIRRMSTDQTDLAFADDLFVFAGCDPSDPDGAPQ